MRQFRWNYYIMDIFHNFKNVIRWGDQDIINILLYYYPSTIFNKFWVLYRNEKHFENVRKKYGIQKFFKDLKLQIRIQFF